MQAKRDREFVCSHITINSVFFVHLFLDFRELRYDGGTMIEGTRQFRGKKNSPPSTTNEEKIPVATAAVEGDATNLDRRAWFSSLVPALGNGLVEILRASNNLKRDLSSRD
jgi:hypothetical protein